MTQLRLKNYLHRKVTVIIWFDSQDTLENAMDSVLARNQGDLLDIGHAALISQEAGILNNNITAVEGVICGMMLGASMLALGIVQRGALDLPGGAAALALGLSIIVGSLVGGVIGYAVARFTGFGFSPALLDQTARQLTGNRIALILHIHHHQIPALREMLAEFTKDVNEVCAKSNEKYNHS